MKPSVVYEYNNSVYINITNRCPNLCVFCIKVKWSMKYRGYDLKLDREPDADEILKEIDLMFKSKKYPEIVFCGYGEPLMRWDTVKNVCSRIRNGFSVNIPSDVKIRINTNGFGNLINKRDITLEMKGLIDSLHVSLNSVDREKWYEIMKPLKEYREMAFESVIDFIKKAQENVKEVVVTAVDIEGVDIAAVKSFAENHNLSFRLRPYLDEYEET